MTPLKVAIAGLGTVGGGVASILVEHQLSGIVELSKILVRDLSKAESYPHYSKIKQQLTDQPEQVLEDPEVRVLIECIGGTTVSKDLIEKALQSGKHVITANKDLMAIAGQELSELAAKNHVHLLYEASVGGALPIIRLLENYFHSPDIEGMIGILNGTTNYILSKMDTEGLSFEQALEEAQELGFAEQDPTNDIKGYDARYKLSLLMQLVTGQWFDVDGIRVEGIDQLCTADFEYAARMNKKIKLIAYFRKKADGIAAFVTPLMVNFDHIAAHTQGSTNLCTIFHKHADSISIIGKGAGALPTASSMVADLYHIVSHLEPQQTCTASHNHTLKSFDSLEFHHTLRFEVNDGPGIVGEVGGILSEHDISIYALEQLPQYHQVSDQQPIIFTVTLEPCNEGTLQKALASINTLNSIMKPVHVLREVTLS